MPALTVAALSFASLFTNSPTVTVSLVGAPSGEWPPITIRMPGGSEIVADSAEELSALKLVEVGRYTVSGPVFRAATGLVDTIYDPQADLVQEVKEGETAHLTFRYFARNGTGMVWVATTRTQDEDDWSKGTLRSLLGTDLAGGKVRVSDTITTGPRSGSGVVLPSGAYLFSDAWDNDTVMRIGASDLAARGVPRPAGAVEQGHMTRDPSGRVWVGRQEVARAYVPDASGALGAPVVELKRDEDAEEPLDLATLVFRHDGSAIVFGAGGLAIIPAADLARSHTVNPRWRKIPAGVQGSAAVDAEGNLWTANANGAVHRFAKADLDGRGALTPREYEVELGLHSVTIDAEGGVLALVSYTGNLYRLKPGGSTFEKLGSIGTGLDLSSTLTLNPPAEGTPLAQGFPSRLKR